MTVPALQTTSLVAGYERDLPIVRGIDLSVAPGEFVAILGPNGAGKSTYVKAIAGIVPTFEGSVFLGGQDITSTPLHQRSGKGLGFVPQTENIFTTLSIAENLQLAADVLPRAMRAQRLEKVYAKFPDLAGRPRLRAGQLSGGQRQMLAVARALIMEPQVLILDEPSAGLSPKIVGSVFTMLKAINKAGVTILLVEQNVRAALSVVDRGVILVEGELRHEGKADALTSDPLLAELYLGAQPARKATA
jgi:ABC-type branched-subunit amino acid transport system ATPase component